jgi:hypothetical protein
LLYSLCENCPGMPAEVLPYLIPNVCLGGGDGNIKAWMCCGNFAGVLIYKLKRDAINRG